jgi:hypothetical protein
MGIAVASPIFFEVSSLVYGWSAAAIASSFLFRLLMYVGFGWCRL